MSACDRVVITATSSQGGQTTVSWLEFTAATLTGFTIVFAQDGTSTPFQADAAAKTVTVPFTVTNPNCVVTVAPDLDGAPSADQTSFRTPLPFPPAPIDPTAGRPIILRACSDGASILVNWMPSTLEDVQGVYLTVIKNNEKMTNFKVEGATITSYTVAYVCTAGNYYQVQLTPYDKFDILPEAASMPQLVPYPSA